MDSDGRGGHLIHRAVTYWAAERPEAAALVSAGNVCSYRTLDSASDAYAARLAGRGVRPGLIVPLTLPRSPQLVALQLAVLKCGAAYVNVDGAWPAARQRAILDQVRPHLVISRGAAAFSPGTEVWDPGDTDLARMANQGEGVGPVVAGNDPATVFFTSGTTGVPKGIVVPHRAVTRLFRPGGLAGFGPGHATPQVAALPWDMYAFEVWGQLTAGGTVVFAEGAHPMPGSLRESIGKFGVDTLWLTTTLFNLFVDEDLECFAGIQELYTGGEKLSPAHIRSFIKRYPSVSVYNGYGPAENCMLTTTRLIQPGDCEAAEGIPVGTAVPGTEVLVLGEHGQRAAPGEQGEVCAAGDGLALGYLGQPELTTEKFPTVRVDGTPTRVYRTGDLGFFDNRGVLHFRGRRDRQVKVSGYRIELGEVEAAARELPAVRECVAIPLKAAGDRVIGIALCYIAAPGNGQDAGSGSSGDSPGTSEPEVRRALREVLPAHLMPTTLRRFDRFPVTSTGKVDLARMSQA